jgi:protein O-GlcNAc transferase
MMQFQEKNYSEAASSNGINRPVLAQAQPSDAHAYFELGNALFNDGELDFAADAFRKGMSFGRVFADIHNNQGIDNASQGLTNQAERSFLASLDVNPNHLNARANLAKIYYSQERWGEATDCYQQILRIQSTQASTHFKLGLCLHKLDRLEEAAASYREAIQREPNHVDAHNNLGVVYFALGLNEEGVACFRRAVELNPANVVAHFNIIFGLHFDPQTSPATIFEECRRFEFGHAEPLRGAILPYPNEPEPERRLRIGYVSSHFTTHPVGRFLLPLLTSHDPLQVEVYCYSSVAAPDVLTARVRGLVDCWRDVRHMPDERLAQLVRSDKIDILVDLAMHAAESRLLLFARKPAPIQITYLAYCSTTGLSAMDYRLTDPYLEPPGLGDYFYSESSICLPETYWCYWPVFTAPLLPPPVQKTGHITFGSLNGLGKFTRATLQTWSRLLRCVPDSRLLLCVPPRSRGRVSDIFLQEIGSADRIDFVDRMPVRGYFESYNQIDIGLDPYPFGGGTTTCDALWMGVPVVTLAGNTGVGRGGVSILSNIGLTELIARNVEDYIAIAVKLTQDLPRLSALRESMRERMRHSPLMNAPRFASHVETAYRAIWQNWCAPVKP